MEKRIDHIFKNGQLSRRDFIKFSGAAAGLLAGGQLLNNPSFALAKDKPQVVSVHDSNVTDYDYGTYSYWEHVKHVNQDVVNNMVAYGVMALTGRRTIEDAWSTLIPYRSGESVVMKFNLNANGINKNNNFLDGLPQTANAIIDGLTSIGVPGNKIWITDPSRQVSTEFRNIIKNPDIQYFTSNKWGDSDPNYHIVPYVMPDSSDASIASAPELNGEKILPSQVFVDADHLINVPKFVSHGSYVTLALKNHYGSVLWEHYDRPSMHAFFNAGGNTAGCDLEHTNILADINNNSHIRDKTRLIVGEGLFGNAYACWLEPIRWNIFGNGSPNIFFFSTDPIAISSVMTDYIMAERGWQNHEQLHAGEYIGLGVHDHWDSFETKQYSLIDYRRIDLDIDPPSNFRIIH